MIMSKPEEIKLARLRQGLSIRALGKAAGVCAATVHKLENKEKSATPKTARLMSEALHTPMEKLFTLSVGGNADGV